MAQSGLLTCKPLVQVPTLHRVVQRLMELMLHETVVCTCNVFFVYGDTMCAVTVLEASKQCMTGGTSNWVRVIADLLGVRQAMHFSCCFPWNLVCVKVMALLQPVQSTSALARELQQQVKQLSVAVAQ